MELGWNAVSLRPRMIYNMARRAYEVEFSESVGFQSE